jgi:hypothetical protein
MRKPIQVCYEAGSETVLPNGSVILPLGEIVLGRFSLILSKETIDHIYRLSHRPSDGQKLLDVLSRAERVPAGWTITALAAGAVESESACD